MRFAAADCRASVSVSIVNPCSVVANQAGVNAFCCTSVAAPTATSARALPVCSSLAAIGSGTRIEARPAAASSATVEPPAREITSCARARRSATSAKKGEISASIPAAA